MSTAPATLSFPQARILVFCRAPQPGRVKTRLARHIGDTHATACHRALARHTLATVCRAGLAPVQLYGTPHTRHPFFAECAARWPLSLHEQQGEDLGARMHAALHAALDEAESALVIGTDCPLLTADDLRRALELLQAGRPAVLGPAEDGGYVLLGLRRSDAGLFRDIPWGTAAVLGETRARLPAGAQELPLRWDIDELADLERLAAVEGLPAGPLARFLAAAPWRV